MGLLAESNTGRHPLLAFHCSTSVNRLPRVIVEKEALVEDSVIFDDVIIEPYANIRQSIVDKEARIQQGTYIGYDAEADKRRGCWISDTDI